MMMKSEDGDLIKQTCYLIPLNDIVNDLVVTVPDMDVSPEGVGKHITSVVAGLIQLGVNDLMMFNAKEIEYGRYSSDIVNHYLIHDDKLSVVEKITLEILKRVQTETNTTWLSHVWNYKLINLNYLAVCIDAKDFVNDNEEDPGAR